MKPEVHDSPPVARPLAQEEQVSIRLPKTLLERAEKITDKVRQDPDNVLIGMTRATVLRLAIARGLSVLETEHGIVPPAPKSEPKPKKR